MSSNNHNPSMNSNIMSSLKVHFLSFFRTWNSSQTMRPSAPSRIRIQKQIQWRKWGGQSLITLCIIIILLLICDEFAFFRIHKRRRDLYLRFIEWSTPSIDPAHAAVSECRSIQFTAEIECHRKEHWDYIWFQHIRKAGGSSVCQMLINNGLAAERKWGDPPHCLLFGHFSNFGVDQDLNAKKRMKLMNELVSIFLFG